MLKDIKRGYINCVITKYLLRLGRNYAKVGYYTEEFFIEYGVRFIAVNDGFDTMHDEENDIAPFKNVLNEDNAKGAIPDALYVQLMKWYEDEHR